MAVEVITFGCRLNTYESSIIRDKATTAGLTNTFIINSCAVTSEAERQLRQSIRRIKKNHPDAKIVVTGCAAQVNADKYASLSEVDVVIGNTEKLSDEAYKMIVEAEINPSLTARVQGAVMVTDIMQNNTIVTSTVQWVTGRARGYLQVQTGCNHRCTFCIIPYGRGNSKSAPFGAILSQAKFLMAQGYNELVITGVDITDYGLDMPGKPSLGQLVKRLFRNLPNLQRLRLSSVDVAEIDDDLLDVIVNEQRLMPHLHLSLQSGDNMILKRMKRRHTREQVIEFCQNVMSARPDIVFGADIIAGFPTETDSMFENTYKLLEEVQKIIHLHVFPYSERHGTPAARMPQVERDIRKKRALCLRKLGDQLLHAHMQQQIGKGVKIVLEGDNIGRAEDFCVVKIDTETFMGERGKIYECTIKSVEDDKMIASCL